MARGAASRCRPPNRYNSLTQVSTYMHASGAGCVPYVCTARIHDAAIYAASSRYINVKRGAKLRRQSTTQLRRRPACFIFIRFRLCFDFSACECERPTVCHIREDSPGRQHSSIHSHNLKIKTIVSVNP